MLRRFGVIGSVASLPLAVGLLLLGVALAPGAVAYIALRGGAMVVENSSYRSGYELLYGAMPARQKRSAKVLIDLGCDRLGGAAASGLVILVLAAVGPESNGTLLILASIVAAMLVGLIVAVRVSYIQALGEQLRPEQPPSDAASAAARARTMASTFVFDLDDWNAFDDAQVSEMGLRLSAADLRLLVRERVSKADLAGLAPEVRHCAAEERVALLSETPLRASLRRCAAVDTIEPALHRAAPAVVGALADVLLSPGDELGVRIMAASLLAEVPNARSASALDAGMDDRSPRVRRACAIALLRLVDERKDLRPSQARVVQWVEQELHRSTPRAVTEYAFELSSPFREDSQGRTLALSVETAFLLLSLRGGVSGLRLALDALSGGDAGRRGASLEYLDNVLPRQVRSRLQTLAQSPARTHPERRFADQRVDELAAQLRSGSLSIAGLRRTMRARG